MFLTILLSTALILCVTRTAEAEDETEDQSQVYENSNFSSNLSSHEENEFGLSSVISSLGRSIHGTYTNNATGFTLNLPQGWNGYEVNFGIITTTIIPNESTSAINSQNEVMKISAINKYTLYSMLGVMESFNSSGSIEGIMNNTNNVSQCVKSYLHPTLWFQM